MKNSKGFTLIELAVAVLVIAVLVSSIALLSGGITRNTQGSVVVSAITKVQNAVYEYAEDNNIFPNSLDNLVSPYNYLQNIPESSNTVTVGNTGVTITYQTSNSNCPRQVLVINFPNPTLCQATANKLQTTVINNCSSDQLVMCL